MDDDVDIIWPAAAVREVGPRERLLAGQGPLTDAELLRVLIADGRRGDDEMVAHALLARFGTLRDLMRADAAELLGVPGIGPARVSRLKSGIELWRRAARELRPEKLRFRSSRDIYDVIVGDLRDLRHEVFEVLLLDARNGLMARHRVSMGTTTGSLVHPREVFRPAIVAGAVGLVMAHNHPSGDPTPSRDDLEITARVVSAGRIVGINVLDHLIVGDAGYVSFADIGELV